MPPKIIPVTTPEALAAIMRADGDSSPGEARRRLEESAGTDVTVVRPEDLSPDDPKILVGTSYSRGQRFRSPCSVCKGGVWHETKRPEGAWMLCSPCFRELQRRGLLPGKAP